MKEGTAFLRTTASQLSWLQQSRGSVMGQREEAKHRRLGWGSAKKMKAAVACGDAVTAVEVIGRSTERQLLQRWARATLRARLGEVEAKVAVTDEEGTMARSLARRRR